MNDKQPSIGGVMAFVIPIVTAWLLADTSHPYWSRRDYLIGVLVGIGSTNIVRFVFEFIRAKRLHD